VVEGTAPRPRRDKSRHASPGRAQAVAAAGRAAAAPVVAEEGKEEEAVVLVVGWVARKAEEREEGNRYGFAAVHRIRSLASSTRSISKDRDPYPPRREAKLPECD